MALSKEPNMVSGIKLEHCGGQGRVSPRPHVRGGCITPSAGSPVRIFLSYRDCLGYSHTFPEQPTSNHGLRCEYKSLTILAQC